ncbi:hypothetical protein WN944_002847 [Citrus x changshan-huyou]|uniref:Uncharacterized protein n=1 Tax=Citrus x changshan-huyou TaxID=2935761 RepID=A0AAP0QS69_9ROSI
MADGSSSGKQLLARKGYKGAATDVWSCGIDQADYKFSHWLTESQKQLIPGILDPSPIRLPSNETIKKLEAAAMDVSLSEEKTNNFKVIKVPPTNCVVEISKSVGKLKVYKEMRHFKRKFQRKPASLARVPRK